MRNRSRIAGPGALVLAAVLTAGCASKDLRAPHPQDPWEGYNRQVHAFNDAFDRAIFLPVARAYHDITPDPVEQGIDNFFVHWRYPLRIVNMTLQGKLGQAGEGIGRFAINTTVGLLGFIDVAAKEGYPEINEDFGQTLGVWGWKESRYFVLPFLGPSTLRDTIDVGLDSYLAPPAYYARKNDIYWPLALRLVGVRAQLLPQQDAIDEAYDPYAFVRDAYLQRREFLIYDGDPPLPDYDALLEE